MSTAGRWPPGSKVIDLTLQRRHRTEDDVIQVTITCGEYRGGRRLLALKRRLDEEGATLSESERREIEREIGELERELGMD